MTDTSIDQVAEQLLRDAARSLTAPEAGECLQCFVARMLDAFGCDRSLRFARRYRDVRVPSAIALDRRLRRVGSSCDCQIFLNGWWLHRRFWSPEHRIEHEGLTYLVEAEPPPFLPACARVRRGSSQPCSIWQRRDRDW